MPSCAVSSGSETGCVQCGRGVACDVGGPGWVRLRGHLDLEGVRSGSGVEAASSLALQESHVKPGFRRPGPRATSVLQPGEVSRGAVSPRLSFLVCKTRRRAKASISRACETPCVLCLNVRSPNIGETPLTACDPAFLQPMWPRDRTLLCNVLVSWEPSVEGFWKTPCLCL